METKIIEEAFLAYLKMVGLDINKLSEVQITETRRAFFAGAGYMFRAMEVIGEAPEQDGIKLIESFEHQIETFFELEVLKNV